MRQWKQLSKAPCQGSLFSTRSERAENSRHLEKHKFRQIVQGNETSLGSNKNTETTQEYLTIGKFGDEKICVYYYDVKGTWYIIAIATQWFRFS